MRLKLNISPCPNDTFMFDAIVNRRIDCRGVDFDVRFADIEELNHLVCDGDVDVSKISYATIPRIAHSYKVLDSGSAMGRGNGPTLVSNCNIYHNLMNNNPKIAIPGESTTANLLLKRLYPNILSKTAMLFSEIGDAVSSGEYDAGVLIHEGRFTYQERGLQLVADLGLEWERRENTVLPLGAIVAKSSLGAETQRLISDIIRESVEFAMANPKVSREFIKEHAQEMEDSVIESHIELFVNSFSLSLGDEGRRAVTTLLGDEYSDIFISEN